MRAEEAEMLEGHHVEAPSRLGTDHRLANPVYQAAAAKR